MTFAFNWQDPDEMTTLKILAEGEASFKVQQVYEYDERGNLLCSRKSGEQMIKVELMVTDARGASGLVYDYILSSQPWKLKNLCWAVNKPDIYTDAKDGQLNPQKLVAEKGRCIIKTDRPTDPRFEDKSTIAKYLDGVKAAQDQAHQDSMPDDEIPF